MASHQLQFKTHQGSPYPTVKLPWFSRGTEPVIILRPNLDADARKLPSKVEDKSPVTYDYDKGYSGSGGELPKRDFEVTARSRTDDEIVAIHIIVLEKKETAEPPEFRLRIQSPARQGLRFSYSEDNSPINHSKFLRSIFTLDPAKIAQPIHLEAISLMGILPESDTDPEKITIGDKIDYAMPFRIELLVDGEVEDTKAVMIAPWLIPSNLEEPERMFVSELPFRNDIELSQNSNTGTILDLRKALQSKGQDFLVVVPPKQNQEDLWHQDQTQVGVCNSPSGHNTIALHLPRYGGNVDGDPSKGNLGLFIDSFFPSANLGTYSGLRNKVVNGREFKGKDVDGKPFTLTPLQASKMQFLFNAAFQLQMTLEGWIVRKQGDIMLTDSVRTAFTNLGALADNATQLYATELQTSTVLAQQLKRLVATARELSKLIVWNPAAADDEVGQVKVSVKGVWENVCTETEFDKIETVVSGLNSALNYGGNIEVSPPLEEAPFGKIIVGNKPNGNRPMSPLLLELMGAQSWQPLVEIDTEWLAVGHVDELIAFVPAPSLSAKSALLVADSNFALDILREASDLWKSGRAGDTNARASLDRVTPEPITHLPKTHRDRYMNKGNHPLTHLLRGKFWYEARNDLKKSGPRNTSKVHIMLLEMLQTNPKDLGADFGLDRAFRAKDADYYSATINVNEFLAIATTGNEYVANGVLSRNLDILKKALPNVPILPVPVLFDLSTTSDDRTARESFAKANNITSTWPDQVDAFSPNMVNIQTVGNHLLVPKPFGPRMKPEDAIAVIKKVLSQRSSPATAVLGAHLIRQQGLDKVTVWVESPFGNERGRHLSTDLAIIAREFEESFKDRTEARNQIRKANPRMFDGNDNFLTDGVHQVTIPENTVDLFELYMVAVGSAMGVKISFIDTWFYHVRKGGIHCGTNWIPKVDKSRYEWWKHQPPRLRTVTDQL